MNRDETKRHIAIMQAFVDGKKIQARPYEGGEWVNADWPEWKWHEREYRIRPVPREFWLNTKTGLACEAWEFSPVPVQDYIRVREVIEP